MTREANADATFEAMQRRMLLGPEAATSLPAKRTAA